MLVFKTSGETLNSVIYNQKHAFPTLPSWSPGELALISKNKEPRSKDPQIQYVAAIKNIRKLLAGESEQYWPGTEGRWVYLVELYDTKKIPQPFNLKDIFGKEGSKPYGSAVQFTYIRAEHEKKLRDYLKKLGVI